MLQDKVDQLKRETSYEIMGAYLAAVAQSVAVIDKNTPLKTLGESFCLYDSNNPIDFTKRSLVDLNDFGSAPEAGGVTSSVITQANDKIQKRAESLSRYNLSQLEQESELAKYAKKVQQAASIVASGEGALDNDLKEDFRVLLKEAKNEFIKREQEEEVEEAPTDFEDVPEEDNLNDDFSNEENLDDFSVEPDEEEFGEDNTEDENSTEDVENGTGTEQPEGEDTNPEDEDFGIPSGKFESSYINPGNRTANGELFKGDNKLRRLYMDYLAIRQRGYELKGKSQNDLTKMAADMVTDYISDVNTDMFDPEKFKTVGKIVKNKDGSNKVIITKPLATLNHYIDSIMANNNDEELKYNIDWKKGYKVRGKAYTVGALLGLAAVIPKMIKDTIRAGVDKTTNISLVTALFPTITAVISMGATSLFRKVKARLSNKEIKKPDVKYINLGIAKNVMEQLTEQFSYLSEQADKKAANGDKLAVKEKKAFEKSVKLSQQLAVKIKEEMTKLEPEVNRIIEENSKKEAVAESVKLNNVFEMDEDEFSKVLSNRNLMLPYSENSKYYYNNNIISISPYDLKRMVKDIIDIEATSIQMLGESYKLSNVINNDQLALKHKTTVNELAIVIAARNKFGFR